MSPAPTILPAALAALFALGCSATDAPTVELTNSAGKADEITLNFNIDAGESIDLGLDCDDAEGCDIAIHVISDMVAGAMAGSLDVTLYRPDGFSRTDAVYLDQTGRGSSGFFAQETGYYSVAIVNNTGADQYLGIAASWAAARPDTGAANGTACAAPEDCPEGQACLGIGEGQTGFCSSSCADLGQLRCDAGGDSLCVPLDESGEEAYCFKSCDLMVLDCGGDHLECVNGATDAFGNEIGLCVVSAAAEGTGE